MQKKTSQNKFIKLIKMPIKALGRARDSYVRTMNKYADMGTYDGLGWGGPVYVDPMPRSVSASTMRTVNTDRDFKELVRAASTGSLKNRNILVTGLSNGSASGTSTLIKGSHVESGRHRDVTRCGSVVMAKIEEDEPSSYDDDVDENVTEKSKLLKNDGVFTRSTRSKVGETRKISLVL
ncbi:hypothetical protein vseg_014136 [Gypsophila vaccaria]